jgi:hypothetical protein
MNKQEQINALRFRIERIEAKLAEQHIPNNFSNLNGSEKPNTCEPDYTHLLPDGYEFCTEQDAEKWVKVEMKNIDDNYEYPIRHIENLSCFKGRWLPIRPIQYHISVHESVTAEPDPYQVDWSNAPNWADVHCFDRDRRGYWYGHRYNVIISDWETMTIGSNFNLPEGKGIERKFRKTIRPKLK